MVVCITMDSSMTMAKSKFVPQVFHISRTFSCKSFDAHSFRSHSESKANEKNFEKVERLSFGTTNEKNANGHLMDDYDPYAHRQIEHPIT